MPGPIGSISEWTVSDLTKWLRDWLTQAPPDFLPFLKAEEVHVYSKLVLRDDLEWLIDKSFKEIGGVGSPAFQNSWVNYGSGYANAAYWKDPFGIVHLRGMISTGTVGQRAFTMAPGYRPAQNHIFSTISNGAAGRVDISTSGAVTPTSPSNNTWVSLSGITYKAI